MSKKTDAAIFHRFTMADDVVHDLEDVVAAPAELDILDHEPTKSEKLEASRMKRSLLGILIAPFGCFRVLSLRW